MGGIVSADPKKPFDIRKVTMLSFVLLCAMNVAICMTLTIFLIISLIISLIVIIVQTIRSLPGLWTGLCYMNSRENTAKQ
jgi:hypothetical protein